MKTKTITLRTFDELPSKLKQVVLDKYRYFNVEDRYWYDWDGKTGFSPDEEKKYGIEDVKDTTDLLDYDYEKMEFSVYPYDNWVHFRDCKFSNDEFARKFLALTPELWEKVYWHFVHPNNDNTTIELDSNDDLTQDELNALSYATNRFDELMTRCAKDLRAEYEHLQSDEQVAETLRINDYYFNEDGEMESV